MTKANLVNDLISEQRNKVRKDRLANLQAGDDIGKIGLGFCSAYLVADKITVTSKHNDDEQYIWESDAASRSFKIRTDTSESLGRGTKIVLHIKEDLTKYLEETRIESLCCLWRSFMPLTYLQLGLEKQNNEQSLEPSIWKTIWNQWMVKVNEHFAGEICGCQPKNVLFWCVVVGIVVFFISKLYYKKSTTFSVVVSIIVCIALYAILYVVHSFCKCSS